MRVGLFDSGIGGLTVLKELINKYPNNEYIYYGDTVNIPYGTKTKEELEILSSKIIEFLIDKSVDIIVIACGTVSSNIGDLLKNKYNIKILDIVSPTIDYINKSKYNKIGVIATNATINSKVFSKNIHKEVKEVACTEFVPIIESSNIDNLNYYISYYLKDLRDRDLIVLGCTHYPIIKNKINDYLKNDVKLLNMAECILDNFNNGNIKNIELYFSKLDSNIINNIKKIMNNCEYSINLKR